MNALARGLLGPLCAASILAQDRPIPYPVRPERDWVAAVKAGTRAENGLPGSKHWTVTAHYAIDAELEPATARLHGHAVLTFENGSPHDVHALVVELRQNLHRPDALRNTKVEITDGMVIEHLQCDGKQLTAEDYSVEGTELQVELATPVQPGGETTLALDFAFTVPHAQNAPRMGHEDNHVFYLGYWYPQFAVHDDLQGWVPDPYLGNAEFYMDYADYDVALTVPVGFLVRGTGELQNAEAVLTAAARTALAAAAAGREVVHVVSAEDLQAGRATATADGGKLTWKFHADKVRDFALAASDQYVWDATHAVVKDKGGPGVDGTAMIHAVYRPRARAWHRAAQYAQHTIEWVSATIGAYPWPQMTACEGGSGGMEYPMMTLIGDVGVPAMQQSVIAHELVHMWFPMQVGSNETAHAWMDEGLTEFLTEYVDAAFWKKKHPGRNTLGEYTATVQLLDVEEPLMRHGDRYETELGYGFCSYTKPAAMLHQLIGIFGKDQVFAALRGYVDAWRYKHPTPIDFFRRMNAGLGRDLDWYWRTWCYETWHLDQAIAAVRDVDRGTLVVVDDLGDATNPSRVQVTYEDGSTESQTIDVMPLLRGRRSTELHFGPKVMRVELDPDAVTMDVDRSNNVWKKDG